MYIRGKHPIFHKIVFELRYLQGYTFLDRCGKTMNAIMREAPEWIPRDQVSPQNSPLVSVANNCVFNFSTLKMDFGIEQPIESEIEQNDINHFLEQIDLVSRIVIDQLSLKEFPCVGVRTWYLFRCEDKAESEQWLSKLGLYTLSDRLKSAFDGEVESTGLTVVIVGQDRKYRIGLNGVEKGAQIDRGSEIILVRTSALSKDQDKIFKEQLRRKGSLRAMPRYAAMVDFDAFQEDPISVNPRDFVSTSLDQFLKRLTSALPAQ